MAADPVLRLKRQFPLTSEAAWQALEVQVRPLSRDVLAKVVDAVFDLPRDPECPGRLPDERAFADVIDRILRPAPTIECNLCDGGGFVYALRMTLRLDHAYPDAPHAKATIWLSPMAADYEAATCKMNPAWSIVSWRLSAPVALLCPCPHGARRAVIRLPTNSGANEIRPLSWAAVLGDELPMPRSLGDRSGALLRSMAEVFGYPEGHRHAGRKPADVEAEADAKARRVA